MNRKTLVKVKLDKLVFPEICPVCTSKAEDLVSIVVYEGTQRFDSDRSLVGSWSRGEDKTDVALAQAQGALSFWVPACLTHGSGSILTKSKTVMSIIVFMILFYPLLYFAMGILLSIQYSGSFDGSLLGFGVLLVFIVVDIIYGFYPRALQRKIKFLKVRRAGNEVYIEIHNTAYLERFISLNEMHVDIIKSID